MSVLWRILGFQLLGELAVRLPPRSARIACMALIVLTGAVPVIAVQTGRMWVGEVFILFWLENVVVWAFTFVRILTATGSDTSTGAAAVLPRVGYALFFSFHFGTFTVVHGAFVFIIAGMFLAQEDAVDGFGPGGSGTPDVFSGAAFLWALVAMFLVQLFALVVYWFARGERHGVTLQRVMFAPYPRMLILHVVIIAAFPLSFVFPRAALPVLLLVGLRTALDLLFFLRSRDQAEVASTSAAPATATATP
jgi:Family of unknown function (DUF6498)